MVPAFDCEQLRKLPYKDFLATSYWKDVAASVRKRDGHRCVICNSSKRLDVHHRTYEHHGQEHLFLQDLTTLCHICHERHHFPPPPPKVVVKTVVKFRGPLPPDLCEPQLKLEKRFYRRAAMKLSIKAKTLRKWGRQKTLELLNAPSRNKAIDENPPLPRLNGSIIVGDLASVDTDMPPGDEIVITKEILRKCRANGSFTTATVRAFGLEPKSLTHGWADQLLNQTVTRDVLLQAMRGRHLYSPATFKKRRKFETSTAPIEAHPHGYFTPVNK